MHKSVNKLHYFLTLALLQFAGTTLLCSQDLVIPIEGITIKASRKSGLIKDYASLIIDSIHKSRYAVSDLATILKSETNINITQYGGEGSLSSIRLRGTGPSHTQVNWNGIPVNSPTTGTIDLSLVSSLLADEIEVVYGASGSLFGSGTFGGSLNIINKPDWQNKLSIMAFGEIGSWDHYKTGGGIRFGSKNCQFHAGGFWQSSSNAYQYKNPFVAGNPTEYRVNDTLKAGGFQNHLFLKLPANWTIQAGLWWQHRNKDLPVPMSAGLLYPANQEDATLRIYSRLTKTWKKSAIEILASRFTDTLRYSVFMPGQDSKTKQSGFRSTIGSLGISNRWYPSQWLIIETGTEIESHEAVGTSFTEKKSEVRGALFGSVRLSLKNVTSILGIRQIVFSGSQMKTLYSLGIQYRIPSIHLLARSQVSNKFRLPTLNERFWQPGGNPGLLPETGTGFESGVEWDYKTAGGSVITLSESAYLQNIHHWVQWVPAGTFWSPLNIRFVRCQGLETAFSMKHTAGSFTGIIKVGYNYTESLDMDLPQTETRLNRQISYVPRNQFLMNISLHHRGLDSQLAYRYTGKRFTTDDHDPWLVLAPTHLADAELGYRFHLPQQEVRISFRIHNLFNYSYQLIRAYPAPGRTFFLTINYLFNQTTETYANK